MMLEAGMSVLSRGTSMPPNSSTGTLRYFPCLCGTPREILARECK
jgi:hypothetical protein